MPGPGHTLGEILEEQPNERYTISDKLWAYLRAYREKHEAAGHGFGYSMVGPEDTTRTLSARYHKDGSEILVGQEGKTLVNSLPANARACKDFPMSSSSRCRILRHTGSSATP